MGNVGGMPLGFKIALCYRYLLLETAELDVIKRYFRNEADLDIAYVFDCCLNVGSSRFDAAAYAAEQVEFPHSIQPGLIKITLPIIGISTRCVRSLITG